MYHTEPPIDKTIREWYMNCFVCRCSVWYMIRNLHCTVTIDSVLPNSKTQNAFLFTVNAIFHHTTTPQRWNLEVHQGPQYKKTWRDSLPIDMLISAVSLLVVAQSSSEIPEGLMNNPVVQSMLNLDTRRGGLSLLHLTALPQLGDQIPIVQEAGWASGLFWKCSYDLGLPRF